MKFKAEIEIKNEHLKVLLDYHNGYSLDDEYFNLMDRQDIEEEMAYNEGLLDGGFYQHYPLSPTPLGRFILDLYLKHKDKKLTKKQRIELEAEKFSELRRLKLIKKYKADESGYDNEKN